MFRTTNHQSENGRLEQEKYQNIKQSGLSGRINFGDFRSVSDLCQEIKEISNSELRYDLFIELSSNLANKEDQKLFLAIAAKYGILNEQKISHIVESFDLQVSKFDLLYLAMQEDQISSASDNVDLNSIGLLQSVIDVMQPVMTNGTRVEKRSNQQNPHLVKGAGWDVSKFTINSTSRGNS